MSDTAYRIDGPKDIQTKYLLFWPNNPRLKISDFKEVKYSAKELIDPQNQQKIFKLLQSNEHSVDELIKSMSRVGFMREKAPIVMEIKAINKYLVLEGNRRLTAIRTLLSDNRNAIGGYRYKSLVRIPCWLFVHTSKKIPLDAAVSRLVAEQHIQGQKPHTKIQQAHMLYNAYMGFLLEKCGKTIFSKEPEIIKQTANFFGLGNEELELEIAVVRFYKQLFDAGYETSHKIRERLTWIYKHPTHFKKNFGYQVDQFELDDPGLERYYDIFIKKSCSVHSPTQFKKFLNVMRYGAPTHIEILRENPDKLGLLEQEVLDKKAGQRFYLELKRINKKLKGLKLGDYQKSKSEDRLIKSILVLVTSKLKKLLEMEAEKVEIALEQGVREKIRDYRKTPTDIDEALNLSPDFLFDEIETVLANCPNCSCVRAKLPTYLLKKWEVISRGHPREKFCQMVEKAVQKMVQDYVLEEYRATNDRLRLP